MAGFLAAIVLGLIWVGSIFVAALPLSFMHNLSTSFFALGIVASILTFGVCIIVFSGVISYPFQKAIVPGVFPRDVNHVVYLGRRVFGLCWTSVYYFQQLYFLALAVPQLKNLTFRLFGYRGHNNFTIYPDTWTRDLPLLSFRKGAYLANKATLGTNVCLQNGDILVGPIKVGEAAVLGHLGVMGLGSTLGDFSELGVGATTGIRVKIGKNTQIGAISGLNHGCQIGSNCEVGAQSYIGLKTIIKDGIKLPAGSSIPDGSVIQNQDDVENFRKADAIDLLERKYFVAGILSKGF